MNLEQLTPLEAAAELLLSDDYIVVPIPLANLLGLAEAVLLKKIDAWCASNRKCQKKKYFKNGYWWTNGSYSDWNERLPCVGSPRTIQRLALALEKLDLLVSDHLSPKKSDRTKWYRVNRVKLGQLYLEKAQSLVESIVPDWHGDSDEEEWVEIHSAKLAPSSRQVGMDRVTTCRDALIYNDSLNDSLNDSPPTPKGGEESGGEEEQVRNGNGVKPPMPNINPSLTSKGVNGDIKQSTVIYEDNYSGVAAVATINYAALGMQDPNNRKTRQMREFNWVPDGPWKVDNKLDSNFVDWLTGKWVRDYGKDVHTTRRNVQLHLKKDAANFAIAWDEYHREHLHRFSNAAVRERSGGVLSLDEQQRLLQHSAAVTQAVPEELASVGYTLPSAVEEFTPDIAAKLNCAVPALPQGAENPDCYQEWKPAESVVDISPEEAAANIKRLREMILSKTGKRAMPQIEQAKPRSVAEDLMADLADPGIRFSVDVQARAQRFIGRNEEWCADYNDGGMIVAIYQF